MAEGRGRVTGLRSFLHECDLSQSFSKVAGEFVGRLPIAFRVVVEGTVRSLQTMVQEESYRLGRMPRQKFRPLRDVPSSFMAQAA